VLVGCVLCTLAAGCGDDGGSTSSDGTSGPDVEIGGTAGIARGPVAWPAPDADQVARLAEAAGAPLETHETLVHHVHSHLDVFIDGEHRVVPAGIGIVITDPAVKSFDDLSGTSYGGISPPCAQPCISPLHTHDTSGVIHTESATDDKRTLGQLFRLWDVRLDDRCVDEHCTPDTPIAIYVDGDEVPLADAPDIALTDGREIALVIGDPPDRIPAKADFSGA
jgi:hypothetical protein